MNREFSKSKKGYDKLQVDAHINELEKSIAILKQENAELKKDLSESEQQLAAMRQKQDLIVKSIMGAMQKAEQIENLTRQKYEFDMQQLTAFHERWLGYYNKLIAQYPLDSQLRGLNGFNRAMNKLLNTKAPLDNKLMTKIEEHLSDAEAQYLSESARLNAIHANKPQISDDFDPLNSEIPTFNPEDTIKNLIRRQIEEESQKKRKKAAPTPETTSFSYEEALNPTQPLADILKELGLE